MKFTSLPLAFCLLTPALSAVAPYPSVLTVKYNDQMLPVVHVHATDPVVLVDGKEKAVRSEPAYLMQGANGFADNYVASPPGSLGGPFRIHFLGSGGGPYTSMTYIEVPLTARKTIKRGFAVVVVYADLEKTKDMREKALGLPDKSPALADVFYTGTVIIVHELPELPAGKAVKVKFTAGGSVALLSTDYFVQIFDDEGREVRTADVEYAWRFYALRARARLTQAVAKYLEKFKGADHDAVPAMKPKPIFPADAVMPTGQVLVTLTVESDGSVSAVEADAVKDDGVRQSLTNALGGWLFLPRLKGGVPVATKVSFPLKF
jgi:hypothetical protein